MYRGKSKRIRGKHISGGPAVCVFVGECLCAGCQFFTHTHTRTRDLNQQYSLHSLTLLKFSTSVSLQTPFTLYRSVQVFSFFFNLYLFPLSSQPLHILSFLPSSTPSFNLLSYNLHVAFLHPILVSHPRILSSTFLSYLLFFTLSFLVLNLPQPLPLPLPFSFIKYYVAFSFIFPYNIAQNISLSSTSSTSLLPPLCPPSPLLLPPSFSQILIFLSSSLSYIGYFFLNLPPAKHSFHLLVHHPSHSSSSLTPYLSSPPTHPLFVTSSFIPFPPSQSIHSVVHSSDFAFPFPALRN